MQKRNHYNTKQKELLMGYFEKAPGVHITAGEVCSYLRGQGATIGQSTVYRQLDRLVDEGILKKYIFDSTAPACFEYAPEKESEKAAPCFHAKCEKCGQLIHLHCDEIMEFTHHLYTEHHFTLDPTRTVFYGLCEACATGSVNEDKEN